MAIADTARSSAAQKRWIAHKLPHECPVMNVYRPTLDHLARSATLPASESSRQRCITLQRLPDHTLPSNAVAAPSPADAVQPNALPRLPSIQRRFTKQAQYARETKDLAARLALLLHARECCRGDAGCTVPNCSIARGVLDHCQECFLADGECHASCAQAKHLLRHFRICRARNFAVECSICSTLRSECAWAMHHVKSLTPLFFSTTQSGAARVSAPAMTSLQTSSNSHSTNSVSRALEGPVSLRRVVSDDPSLQRHRGPMSPLAVQTAKRQRFE